jgi:trimeric autotransporter adhesin
MEAKRTTVRPGQAPATFSCGPARTWTQQAYLKASNTGESDSFGNSVAVFGNTVVVAALNESSSASGVNGNQADDSATFAGAAYVFVRNQTTWSQQAYLKASNPGSDDSFGASVAIYGDTVIVGTPGEDSAATGVNAEQRDESAINSGAVYVFVRSETNWSQQAYLKASDTGINDSFGRAVSISGEFAMIGAAGEDSDATGVDGNEGDNSSVDAGAAYAFTRQGTALEPIGLLQGVEHGGDRFIRPWRYRVKT